MKTDGLESLLFTSNPRRNYRIKPDPDMPFQGDPRIQRLAVEAIGMEFPQVRATDPLRKIFLHLNPGTLSELDPDRFREELRINPEFEVLLEHLAEESVQEAQNIVRNVDLTRPLPEVGRQITLHRVDHLAQFAFSNRRYRGAEGKLQEVVDLLETPGTEGLREVEGDLLNRSIMTTSPDRAQVFMNAADVLATYNMTVEEPENLQNHAALLQFRLDVPDLKFQELSVIRSCFAEKPGISPIAS